MEVSITLLQEIEHKALTLSISERGKLIRNLLTTIDNQSDYSNDFEKEIQERVNKIKSGNAVGIPALQLMFFQILRKNTNEKVVIIFYDMKMVAVPLCPFTVSGETIGKGLLAQILKECDLSREELQKLM
jgi:hypothetical protein